MQNTVLSVLSESTLLITLNRPEALNALNTATLNELNKAFDKVYDDPDIRGVIITGSGEKAFVAGADISEFSKVNELNARKFAETGQEIFSQIERCPKPVIAAVNGFALGGGCELAMACHIRIATPNAKFGQPEVNLGIIPGYGGTQRLTQLIGKGHALELMMTGEMITAERAQQLGLVNYMVTSHEELMSKSREILFTIFEKAPIAISSVIESVNAYFQEGDGYQTEANCFSHCVSTSDFKEGTTAFLEKRKAVFTGK